MFKSAIQLAVIEKENGRIKLTKNEWRQFGNQKRACHCITVISGADCVKS